MTLAVRNALICALLLCPAFAGEGVHWSYEGAEGPAHWGDLSPDYIACAEGMRQSPIDLSTDADEDDDEDDEAGKRARFHIDYQTNVTVDVLHNGHTIQANVPAGSGTLRLGRKDYSLLQFHFHTPSEHLLDGNAYAMELHLVHKNAADELAVIGVLLAQGAAHSGLASVFAHLPQQKGENHWVEGLDLNALLPADADMFRYNGSLTTPPCSEGVAWHVMAEPMTVDAAQFHAFDQLFSGAHYPDGNRRPVQPLNGRRVRR